MISSMFDPKLALPYARVQEDTRTPAALLDFVEAKGREVAAALAALRATLPPVDTG